LGAKFTPNTFGIDLLFHHPSKPVPRYIKRLAEEVLVAAVESCPVSNPPADPGDTRRVQHRGFTRPPKKRVKAPGALKRSHRVRPGLQPGSQIVEATERYALAVHNGRRAVNISPVRATALRWVNPDGSVTYTRKTVHQKARAPHPWLRTALVRKIPNRR
jgi:hypothetical protein